MIMIGIIDYGAGNLLSVKKALEYLGEKPRIIHSQKDLEGMEKLILPGVGAFQSAIENLKSRGIYEDIREWLVSDRPFLGICLGMQLLFEESEESGEAKGFEIFRGKVLRFKERKVPQIGWNQVSIRKRSRMMDGIGDGSFFYFLHGYFVEAVDEEITVGETEYGITYSSVIEKSNIFAVQFHPEKSGKNGLKLLQNWIKPERGKR
jgi:glutamine amidotransferase